MKKTIIIIFVFYLAYLGYASITYLKRFDFNDTNALDKWSEMVLNGHVNYDHVISEDNGYIKALSDRTCSALYYRIGFKLRDYPVLAWKWRVLRFPDKSQAATEKERDDYAARVYVIFPFLNFSSSKFIEYVWADDKPIDTVMDSPEGSNIKMIVVRNGTATDGEWVEEARNVYDDYLKAFGSKPSLNAGAIAIMCDADSTSTSAESLFDDIAIGTEAGPIRRLD